jgi:CheY-like chemotaxis protein
MLEEQQMPLKVLLVDDDHSDLALMGMAIARSQRNIWLQTASDAQRAIDYLAGKDDYADRSMHPLPDLVILDLDMPLSGGFDFLDWRRGSPVSASIPVAILSGWAYPGAIQTALSMGAVASFAKPQQFEDWTSVVEQVWNLGMSLGLALLKPFSNLSNPLRHNQSAPDQ